MRFPGPDVNRDWVSFTWTPDRCHMPYLTSSAAVYGLRLGSGNRAATTCSSSHVMPYTPIKQAINVPNTVAIKTRAPCRHRQRGADRGHAIWQALQGLVSAPASFQQPARLQGVPVHLRCA